MSLKVNGKSTCYLKFISAFICLATAILSPFQSGAQEASTQLWTDFTQNLKLKKEYTFDNEISYRTVLSDVDKWRSLIIQPGMSKALGKRWDMMAYLGLIGTLEQATYNTYEIRPGLGVMYKIKIKGKFLMGILGRVELREQYTDKTDSWKESFRSRFRLDETYLINGESYEKNHFWYSWLDQEAFVVLDEGLKERYSNELMLRAGLGYKINRWRYEVIYAYQLSKNTIDKEFALDNVGIIRLRLRYYFNEKVLIK